MATIVEHSSFRIEERGADLVLQLLTPSPPWENGGLFETIPENIRPAPGNRLWIDFSSMSYFGKDAINLLVRFFVRLHSVGVRVVAVGLSEEALEIIRLVRIEHILDLRSRLPEEPFREPPAEQAGFLQAILDDPADQDVRLIFADWLDERDDPRGEFIRLQCQLADLPADDPRTRRLRQRERELLADHEPTWAGSLPWVASQWEYRRGFVERVVVSLPEFIATADQLAQLAPIRELHLRGGHPRQTGVVSALLAWPPAKHLIALELPYFPLDDAGAEQLVKAEQLARLESFRFPRMPTGTPGVSSAARQLLRARFGEQACPA